MLSISFEEYQRLAFENLKPDQKALCQKVYDQLNKKGDEQRMPLAQIIPLIKKIWEKELLEVRYNSKYQTTLLCLAIRKRYLDIAHALLQAGAEPASVCWEGSNALKLLTNVLNQTIQGIQDVDRDETWSNENQDTEKMRDMIILMITKMSAQNDVQALTGYYEGGNSLGQSPLEDLLQCKENTLASYLPIDATSKTASEQPNEKGRNMMPSSSSYSRR